MKPKKLAGPTKVIVRKKSPAVKVSRRKPKPTDTLPMLVGTGEEGCCCPGAGQPNGLLYWFDGQCAVFPFPTDGTHVLTIIGGGSPGLVWENRAEFGPGVERKKPG